MKSRLQKIADLLAKIDVPEHYEAGQTWCCWCGAVYGRGRRHRSTCTIFYIKEARRLAAGK